MNAPEFVAPIQAFPYQGSKRILAAQILRHFPRDYSRLIEPFAGSAAVSVAARMNGFTGQGLLSDVNAPLMELWKGIISTPEELLETYERLWTEQLEDPGAYFNQVRTLFNQTHEPGLLLYLLMRCVKAAVRYNKQGQFSQSADKRRLGTKPQALRSRIIRVSQLMQNTEVYSAGYEELLFGAAPSDLVYMDPPYQGTSNVPDSRYIQGLSRENFIFALDQAVRRDISFVLSYDAVTANEKYGPTLPRELGLRHLHVSAGTSAQGTLHGRNSQTLESLYLSPGLIRRIGM